MRRCSKCKQDRPPSCFYHSKKGRKDGLTSWCKYCYKQQKDTAYWLGVNKRRTDKATDYINRAKDVPCTDCGVRYPPCVMDFDHISDVKVLSVSKMKAYSIAKIQAEIDKCEVVCSNCHRIRTQERRNL